MLSRAVLLDRRTGLRDDLRQAGHLPRLFLCPQMNPIEEGRAGRPEEERESRGHHRDAAPRAKLAGAMPGRLPASQNRALLQTVVYVRGEPADRFAAQRRIVFQSLAQDGRKIPAHGVAQPLQRRRAVGGGLGVRTAVGGRTGAFPSRLKDRVTGTGGQLLLSRRLGIVRLAREYSPGRKEAAAERALLSPKREQGVRG